MNEEEMQRGNRAIQDIQKEKKKQSVNIPQQIVYLQMYTGLIEPIQKQWHGNQKALNWSWL